MIAPSELLLVDNKLPVDTERFVSPPNGLRLEWKSNTGGDWRVSLRVPNRNGPPASFVGDTLTIWCYAEDELTAADSPLVGVQDSKRNGLPEVPLLAGSAQLPAKKWVRLEFPIANFSGRYLDTSDRRFDPRKLSAVTLAQQLDDGKRHVLTIDDVRIVESAAEDTLPPVAPVGLTVTGEDSHFDLAWQPNRESDLCSYRIYRSDHGKSFRPIGTSAGGFQRYVDFVGESGVERHYKISAIDIDNQESPLSESASGATHAARRRGTPGHGPARLFSLLLGRGQ